MKQLHVVTVGISLLTNYGKAKNLPLETVLRHSRQLKDFILLDPKAACAELNSLEARLGILSRKPKNLGVSLVYAATAGKESALAARLIGNFLEQRGVEVPQLKLKDIALPANPQADPAEAARLAEIGLMNIFDRVEDHVDKMRKRYPELDIEFNATGGYKAETAILYALGCELGIPVYYLHETYRVAITLPVCSVPF